MKPHLRYLKYVLMHKWYVFIMGVAMHRAFDRDGWLSWLWRLLVHDLSKFRPSEWRPYVDRFYGLEGEAWITQRVVEFTGLHEPARCRQIAEARWGEEKKRRQAAFNYAWLLHQHRNNHHWQHWFLREDSGKTYLLLPPAVVVDEMVADWLGAGTKILRWPTVAECVGETIAWYVASRDVIQLRAEARKRVEATLHALAMHYGLIDFAFQMLEQQRRAVTVEVAR